MFSMLLTDGEMFPVTEKNSSLCSWQLLFTWVTQSNEVANFDFVASTLENGKT